MEKRSLLIVLLSRESAFLIILGLKGECQIFRTVAEASSALLHRLSGKRILTHKGSLIDRLGTWSQELRNILVQGREALEKGIPGPEFAKYDIGVTEAEALVGRTGSVVITASRNGGRRLSVLPEEHIVVATSSQLVPSLEDALMPVAGRAEWSSLSIITGPSRTADIEKILVLGAHGPKRLVVFIVDEQ